MARLNNITLYDQFYAAEGQRPFQQRANYVSSLYLQCLHSYKPLKTTRISITLVPDPQPFCPHMAGSVACIYQQVHTPTYNALPEPAKLGYLLDRLHDAVVRLCQAFLWDESVFKQAYQQVQKLLLEAQEVP